MILEIAILKRDLVITFIVQFIVLASGIIVYKLAANMLGVGGFSEYALSRRIISFIQPVLLVGLGVGLPRYIAYAHTGKNLEKPDTYFAGGLAILILFVLTVTLMINLTKDNISFLIFGSSTYSYLILPLSLMLIGVVIHSACYSYFRGRLMMVRANFLQMINMGIVPILAFIMSKTTEDVLEITGLSWLVVSILFLFWITINLRWDNSKVVSCTKELLLYGVRRVPGDIGLAALLTLPASFTAHVVGVKEAGYVAFGTSLLNMTGGFFAPVGTILLPKASQIIATKDINMLRYYTFKLLRITISLTVIGTILFEVFADKIIGLYLGKSFSEVVLIAKVIMVGGVVYPVFTLMRSIVDAYHTRAINSKNILFSLLSFLLLSATAIFFVKGPIYIAACLVISIFLLSSLTILEIRKILSI